MREILYGSAIGLLVLGVTFWIFLRGPLPSAPAPVSAPTPTPFRPSACAAPLPSKLPESLPALVSAMLPPPTATPETETDLTPGRIAELRKRYAAMSTRLIRLRSVESEYMHSIPPSEAPDRYHRMNLIKGSVIPVWIVSMYRDDGDRKMLMDWYGRRNPENQESFQQAFRKLPHPTPAPRAFDDGVSLVETMSAAEQLVPWYEQNVQTTATESNLPSDIVSAEQELETDLFVQSLIGGYLHHHGVALE